MKAIKIFAGTLCLLWASLFGFIAAMDFSHGLALVISAVWLAGTGAFLIVWRNRPMTRDGRIRFGLNICLWSGIFFLITIPDFVRLRSNSAASACINNLRQIDAAANEFALEHNLTNGSPINYPSDLTPFIKLNSLGKIPPCPQGGAYGISRVGDPPTCSLGTNITPAHVLP
jgi:hypothetical protein